MRDCPEGVWLGHLKANASQARSKLRGNCRIENGESLQGGKGAGKSKTRRGSQTGWALVYRHVLRKLCDTSMLLSLHSAQRVCHSKLHNAAIISYVSPPDSANLLQVVATACTAADPTCRASAWRMQALRVREGRGAWLTQLGEASKLSKFGRPVSRASRRSVLSRLTAAGSLARQWHCKVERKASRLLQLLGPRNRRA